MQYICRLFRLFAQKEKTTPPIEQKRQYRNTLTFTKSQMWIWWSKDMTSIEAESWKEIKAFWLADENIDYWEASTEEELNQLIQRAANESWTLVSLGDGAISRASIYEKLVFTKHDVTPIRE